jgi:hypothetical protein
MNQSTSSQDTANDLKSYNSEVAKFKKKLRKYKILFAILTHPATYIILAVLILALLVIAVVNQFKTVEVPIANVCEQRNIEPATCKSELVNEQTDKWIDRGNI